MLYKDNNDIIQQQDKPLKQHVCPSKQLGYPQKTGKVKKHYI